MGRGGEGGEGGGGGGGRREGKMVKAYQQNLYHYTHDAKHRELET